MFSRPYLYVSPRRGLKLFDTGKADIEPAINPIWRRTQKIQGLYTIPFRQFTQIVVFRPGKRIPVNSPSDLKGKVVGTVRGFSYALYDDVFKNNEIIREDSADEIQLLKKLVAGRFDQAFVSLLNIKHQKKINPSYKDLEIGDTIYSLKTMMRIHPSKEKAFNRINNALKQLIDSGEMKKIYDRYLN